jgi:transposase
MSYNPFGGGSGSIVVTPRKVQATDRRLGTQGARLTNTKHGKAVRLTRTRHAVTTNRPKVERVLPTLTEHEQERLARALALAERESTFRATLPSVHIDAND